MLTSGGEREEKEEQEEEEEESEREKETERVEASKTSDITPGEWLIQVFDSLLVGNQVENPRTLLLHSGVEQGTGRGRAKSASNITSNITDSTKVCAFITAVPITKLFAWGKGDSGGHVLRKTTTRGLSGLVCPSRTSERGGEGYCVKGGGGGEGER